MTRTTPVKVTFDSEGVTLTGNLYLPGTAAATPAPGVVVAGTWTSVKELMADRYAERLAERGHAALSFDFTGFGESGEVRRHGIGDRLKYRLAPLVRAMGNHKERPAASVSAHGNGELDEHVQRAR